MKAGVARLGEDEEPPGRHPVLSKSGIGKQGSGPQNDQARDAFRAAFSKVSRETLFESVLDGPLRGELWVVGQFEWLPVTENRGGLNGPTQH